MLIHKMLILFIFCQYAVKSAVSKTQITSDLLQSIVILQFSYWV